MGEIKEEGNSDAETTYYDSLCPTRDNQEYVAKLKEDIMNLRREYSKSRTGLGEENLVKRSFQEDMAKTKMNMTRRNTSSNLKDRDSESSLGLSIKGDVWFGSGRFQDSGERMRLGGGRRFSEGRVERGKKGRSQEFGGEEKIMRLKESTGFHRKQNIPINSKNRKTNEFDGTQNMYKEIMEAVKVSSPANLAYGRERMAAWLLDTRIQ